MDRRRFLSTVGAASVAAATGAPFVPDPAQARGAEPQAGTPAPDDRFLNTLTAVNDLQVPATLSSYQRQIDALSNPRTLAQSALRLVVGFVNPRGRRHQDPSLLVPLK